MKSIEKGVQRKKKVLIKSRKGQIGHDGKKDQNKQNFKGVKKKMTWRLSDKPP